MALRATSPRRHTVAAFATALALGASGCSGAEAPADSSGAVVVFAASSLTEAFAAIGQAFESDHPGVSVTFSFAASSELAAQILEGAPADVFASADWNNMGKLTDAADPPLEPVVFATNRSIIVVAPDNPQGITGVTDLLDDRLVLVTCAPEVPCGTYATTIFERAGISPTPDSYEENVKSVVTKVALGEADAGIAYATDVFAAGDDVAGVEIPPETNVIADYPIVIAPDAPRPATAQAFVDFVLGDEGRQILADHGFSAP